MSVVSIIGAQWGDEGKGRIVDYLATDADVVIRYQGGDNAGHTVVAVVVRIADVGTVELGGSYTIVRVVDTSPAP